MSELGTNNYNNIRFQGQSPAALGLDPNDPRLAAAKENAKERSQQNPAMKVAGALVGAENETPKGLITKILMGLPVFVGLNGLKIPFTNITLVKGVNKWLEQGDSFETSRLGKATNKLDKASEKGFMGKVGKFFERTKQTIKTGKISKPFVNAYNGVKNHFVKHSTDINPRYSFVRGSSHNIGEEIVHDMVKKTVEMHKTNGSRHFTELLHNASESGNYKGAAEKAISEMKKRTGVSDINKIGDKISHLSAKEREVFNQALDGYNKALKSGNAEQISKASRTFVEKSGKMMGEFEAQGFKTYSRKLNLKLMNRGAQEKAYQETVAQMAKLAGVDKNKPVSEILKALEKKGYGDMAEIQRNATKFKYLSKDTGKSFLSKGLKGVNKLSYRAFRGLDPIMMYFVGKTVKDTIDAPKGEKVATFSEGFAEEIVPWALFNAAIRLPYQAMGGLMKAPEALGKAMESKFNSKFAGKAGKAAATPLKWVGNIMNWGENRGTYKMSETQAHKFFGGVSEARIEQARKSGNKTRLNKFLERNKKAETATKEFLEKSKLIKEGKGGPKSWFDRLFFKGEAGMPNQKSFWKGAAKPWKEMNTVMTKNAGWRKFLGAKFARFGGGVAKIAVIFGVLMPLTSEPLKKLSHKVFGKPTRTKEEEAKEKAEAEAEKHKEAQVTTNPATQTANQQANTTTPVQEAPMSPMVAKYLNKSKNDPIGSGPIKTAEQDHLPARSLDSTPVKSFFAKPEPLDTVDKAKFNKAIADIDRALADAEKVISS